MTSSLKNTKFNAATQTETTELDIVIANGIVKDIIIITAIIENCDNEPKLIRTYIPCPNLFDKNNEVFNDICNVSYIEIDVHESNHTMLSIVKKLKKWIKDREYESKYYCEKKPWEIIEEYFGFVDVTDVYTREVAHIHFNL